MKNIIKTLSLGLLLSAPFMQSMEYDEPHKIYNNLISLLPNHKEVAKFARELDKQVLKKLFCMAAAQGNTEAIEALFQIGTNVNSKDKIGQSALLLSAGYNKPKVTEFLLKKGAKTDVLKGTTDVTPLMCASVSGFHSIVEILLENKANPDTQNHGKHTALFYASINGHEEIVQTLLRYRADPLIQYSNGTTFLQLLEKKGFTDSHKNIVKLIKKRRG